MKHFGNLLLAGAMALAACSFALPASVARATEAEPESASGIVNEIANEIQTVNETATMTVSEDETVDRSFYFNESLRGKAIVFYGDSITARHGLKATDKDYIQNLQAELGFYAKNAAVSGATWTRVLATGTNDIFRQFEEIPILNREADCVCVFLGTNDFGRIDTDLRSIGTTADMPETHEEAHTVCGAMNRFLTDLTTANPDVKIVLLTPLWRSEGFDQTNRYGFNLAQVREAIKSVGALYGCRVIDQTNLVTPSNEGSYLQLDNLHVTPEGYRAMADWLMELDRDAE